MAQSDFYLTNGQFEALREVICRVLSRPGYEHMCSANGHAHCITVTGQVYRAMCQAAKETP